MDTKKMKNRILFVGNGTGSMLWRVHPVADYLKRYGYTTTTITSKQLSDSIIHDYDLIVLQMVFDSKLIDRIKELGKKYVFEMDDLLTWAPDDHYAKDDVKRFDWKKGVYEAIRRADAVTATNKRLARHYGFLRIGKSSIKVLPNYINTQFWLREHKPNKNDDIVRIGYMGGVSHVKDLELIRDPLKQILEEYPQTRFIQMGTGGWSSDDPFTEFNYGEDVFSNIPKKQRSYHFGSKMMVYPDKLYSLRLDIGLAPLIKNKFTKSKTPIKWMEYAINKTPSICQEFLYKQVIDHEVNGFLANTQDDYYNYLRRLIENPDMRKEMGERAYADVINKHVFHKHGQKWRRIYDNLLI